MKEIKFIADSMQKRTIFWHLIDQNKIIFFFIVWHVDICMTLLFKMNINQNSFKKIEQNKLICIVWSANFLTTAKFRSAKIISFLHSSKTTQNWYQMKNHNQNTQLFCRRRFLLLFSRDINVQTDESENQINLYIRQNEYSRQIKISFMEERKKNVYNLWSEL